MKVKEKMKKKNNKNDSTQYQIESIFAHFQKESVERKSL
jgi:hypothetical protein